MIQETSVACDLGILPKSMHDGLIDRVHEGDERYRSNIGIAVRHGTLNGKGELVGDDVVILGSPQDPCREHLLAIFDHLALNFQMQYHREDWLVTCSEEGQLLACFGVGKHNDKGVGLRNDRLLIVLKTPGFYRLDVYDASNQKSFSSFLRCGQVVLFDEDMDHQLVMRDAKKRVLTGQLNDEKGEVLKESEMAYFLNLPSPLLNAV